MSERRVLVVEDDREMRQSVVELLEAASWQVTALSRASDAERALAEALPDVILSDVRMPGMSGLELLQSLPADAPPVVLISAHGDIPTAVEAMQAGAYSFVEKPYEPRRLLTILSHAAEQYEMKRSNERLRGRLLALAGLDRVLLGGSEALWAVREAITDLATSPAAVLVRGETGTGKDLVARALHDLGPHSDGPFVAVNTALLTGAALVHQAVEADGGTLFLDEVSACDDAVQAMLLRLIETKELTHPETGQTHRLTLRVLSATNEDIDAAMAEGRFRRDLAFRLNTTEILLPPLRSRAEDIVPLATHFLTELADVYEISPPDLSPEDVAALVAHDWPGNVRELRSVAERRVLAARRGAGTIASAIGRDGDTEDIPSTLREAVAALERELVGRAIQAHDGKMDAVAEALGIGRRTLNDKIVKLGLDKDALL